MEVVAAVSASFSPNWDRSRACGAASSNNRIQQRVPMVMSRRKANFLNRKCTAIRASMQPSDSSSSEAPIAPLQLESSFGKVISRILVSHPHLVFSAVEKQLEQLQTDLDAEKEKKESSASGDNLVLYRRIAEVKSKERRKVLEEILYALLIQEFMSVGVHLIPSVTPLLSSHSSSRADSRLNEDDKLALVHSPEAYEMIKSHLTLVLGSKPSNSNSVTEIGKARLGKLYAASAMYGYVLKRVDERFQLEKSMKTLPEEVVRRTVAIDIQPQEIPENSSRSGSSRGRSSFGGIKLSRLRSYMLSFDQEMLRTYALPRSEEAIRIIEKHTEALFGRSDIVWSRSPQVGLDSTEDEQIEIRSGDLRRLVLEAVSLGSFLWDVESFVDSRYNFVSN